MPDPIVEELLALTQSLLECVAEGDWATYQEMCDPSLTAFEPEALGQLVEGLDFHRYYFNLGGVRGPHHTTLCAPKVRVLGDVALVTYVRLNQRLGPDNAPFTSGFQETRVWQRQQSSWKHVHFHRSPIPGPT
jgi:calcium/calmodulin-dependent protein kinase (CaM kinase) II